MRHFTKKDRIRLEYLDIVVTWVGFVIAVFLCLGVIEWF